MSPSSPSLPSLPLEVKNHILRFCDPCTLAKTAQVSLAFLELSSPLYEDVHIHGIEALRLLFSKRDSPPSLSIAPYLSLTQIRDLTVHLPHPYLYPRPHYHVNLSLDRSPTNSALLLRRLEVTTLFQPNEPWSDLISLSPLVPILHPLHLCLRAISPRAKLLEIRTLLWTRLESLTLVSLGATLPLVGQWSSPGRPRLALVTYQFELASVGGAFYKELVWSAVVANQPMPVGVQVVVVVRDEKARTDVLDQFRRLVGSGRFGSAGNRVLAQTTVEVKQT